LPEIAKEIQNIREKENSARIKRKHREEIFFLIWN